MKPAILSQSPIRPINSLSPSLKQPDYPRFVSKTPEPFQGVVSGLIKSRQRSLRPSSRFMRRELGQNRPLGTSVRYKSSEHWGELIKSIGKELEGVWSKGSEEKRPARLFKAKYDYFNRSPITGISLMDSSFKSGMQRQSHSIEIMNGNKGSINRLFTKRIFKGRGYKPTNIFFT
jgi:hypothetical protein